MIHIITGSTLGSAEYVGDHLNDLLMANKLPTQIYYQADPLVIPKQDTWLLICSTHGAGDYPDNIKPFVNALTSLLEIQKINSSLALEKVSFAVIGLGDSNYDTFCLAGKNLDQLMRDLGAKPLAPCLMIDANKQDIAEEVAERWLIQQSWLVNKINEIQ